MLKCGWCGTAFASRRADARYCCPKCKQAHWRAKRNGVRYTPAECPAEPEPVRVRDADVVGAVREIRCAVAVLDAGRLRADRDMRQLCGRIADGVDGVLREVGL